MRALLVAFCLIALGAVGRPARAGPRHVAFVVVGPEEEAVATEQVMRELLGRLAVEAHVERSDGFDLRVVVTPRDEPDDALVARVWIDLRSGERAVMYLVDRSWREVLVREVPLREASDEVAREQLGHIVQAAIETLLAGGSVGRPREEVSASLGIAVPAPVPPPPPAPPRPPPPAPPPEPEPTAWIGGIAAHWELQGYSDVVPVAHGPGLRGELSIASGAWRPGVSLGMQYRLPIVTSDRPIDARLDTLALRLRGHVGYVLAPSVLLVPALGAGVDLVHLEPVARNPSAALEETRWTGVVFLCAGLGARWYVLEPLALEIGAGLDVSVVDSLYSIERSSGREVVLDPWTVRPTGWLGVQWEP
jgi:hypothetical protein